MHVKRRIALRYSTPRILFLGVPLVFLLFLSLAHADVKRMRVKDPLLNEGLPNVYIIFHDDSLNTRDTLLTDDDGYVTLRIPDTTIIVPPPPDTTVYFLVKQGWNMVSSPVHAQDSTKATIFPSSVSPLFAYDESYVPSSTLTTKRGYWLRNAQDELVSVTGKKIRNDTIRVKRGWNLIGGLSGERLVEDITTVPEGITASNLFTYEQGYVKKDTMSPGKAYWIKVTENGKVILNENTPTGRRSELAALRAGPPAKRFKIEVKDELDPNSKGDYYDYDSSYSKFFDIADSVALFPGSNLLGFRLPLCDSMYQDIYSDHCNGNIFTYIYDWYDNDGNLIRYDTSYIDVTSALSFDKWFTFSDNSDSILQANRGHYLLIQYKKDWPLKVYANRSEMPTMNYSIAFDSSKANWEQATSFMYKSVLLPPLVLEQEVFTIPDEYNMNESGVIYQYDPFISRNRLVQDYPQPFATLPPIRGPARITEIYINNNLGNFGWGPVRSMMNHERKHKFFYSNNSIRENPDHRNDNDHYPMHYFGKLLRVNRSLQDYFPKELPNFGVYKED